MAQPLVAGRSAGLLVLLLVVLAAVCVGGAAAAGLPAPPRPNYQSPELTPWPQPKGPTTNGTASLSVQSKVPWLSTKSKSVILNGAIDRLLDTLGGAGDSSPAIPTSPLPKPAQPPRVVPHDRLARLRLLDTPWAQW